jgi:glycogen operon protein
MSNEKWNSGYVRCLGMMVSGDTMDVRDAHGVPVKDDTFLIFFNAFHEEMGFVLAGKQDVSWELLLNTEDESGFSKEKPTLASGENLVLCPRSMCVLRLLQGTQEDAYSVSWNQQQKHEPTAPPTPHHPQRTFRDATGKTKAPAPETEQHPKKERKRKHHD